MNYSMKRDLTFDYLLDHMLAEDLTKKGFPRKHGLVKESLQKLRRKSRDYQAPFRDGNDFDFVSCDTKYGVYTTWKKFFPEHFTDEEKEELREEWWIHCIPSQYDCTGQTFTSRIAFFEIPSGTWVYHFTSMDV